MILTPVIDMEQEYGLVLEGGGAKGAYQIGAWKALKEAGVKIKAVAGTSVGALNGALICMDELELAQQMWSNLTYSQVMDVDDEKMERWMRGDTSIWEVAKEAFSKMGEGGVDVTPLKEMLEHVVDEEKIRSSPIELYIKTFRVETWEELDIDLKTVAPGLMKDFLLASAYLFPLFKNEKLHGNTYIDGGVINNVPLDSLLDRGYEHIITIRIFGIGREKRVKIPEEIQMYTIEPRVNLGNIMDFNHRKSVRNMKIGYYDAKRMLYGLKGKIYYIEENQEECYYLKQLVQIPEKYLEHLCQWYHVKGSFKSLYRNLVEIILPAAAQELKLGREWEYRDLYLTALEATAKLCRVPKYRIYTVEELVQKVQEKLADMEQKEKNELPLFTVFFEKEEELP